MRRQFRNVNQAVLGAHEVHEGPEVDGLDHLAGVDLAHFRLGGDALDPLDRGLGRLFVHRRHLDRAVVLDVDLGAGLLADLPDNLAAGADDLANLVLVYLDDRDPRRILADPFAGRREGLGHFAQNMEPAVAGLGQRGLHDLLGDRGDLNVHLKRRDAGFGARDLEVHVAQMVLVSENVGEHRKAVVLLDQPHGDTRHRLGQGHTGIHHRQGRAADRRHRRRAVGLGDLGHHANGVREIVLLRQQRLQRPPGELAVSDFAASRAQAEAGLADRIGREVVMEQEVLPVIPVEAVDDLLVLAGAEGGHHQRLGLAAGEQRAAVGPRQNADLAFDGPDGFGVPAVDPLPGVQDVLADDVLFQALERTGDKAAVGFVFAESGDHLLLHRRDPVLALALDGFLVGLAKIALGQFADPGRHRLGAFGRAGQFPGLLGAGFGQLDDCVDHVLVGLVAEHDGAEHGFLGKLGRFRFHHQHALAGPGDDKVERRILELLQTRVKDIFAVDITDPRAADGTHEGQARDGQRGGGADHRNDIRIVFQIVGQHRGDDLGFVAEPVGKQGPDGPVDETRGQRFLFARTPLPLEEAARNFPRGEGLFLVIHRQRKKVHVGIGRFDADRGAQHLGLAITRHHGAVGLPGDLPGLQDQRPAAELNLFPKLFEHIFLFLPTFVLFPNRLRTEARGPDRIAGPSSSCRPRRRHASAAGENKNHWVLATGANRFPAQLLGQL